jgi:hypothetical protein
MQEQPGQQRRPRLSPRARTPALGPGSGSATQSTRSPQRGIAAARPEQPREPKQSYRARAVQAGMSAISTAHRVAGSPIPSTHGHVLRRYEPDRRSPRPRAPGCCSPRGSGHPVALVTPAAPIRVLIRERVSPRFPLGWQPTPRIRRPDSTFRRIAGAPLAYRLPAASSALVGHALAQPQPPVALGG